LRLSLACAEFILHRDGRIRSISFTVSQAGVVRGALKALGDTSDYAFLDVGCGKGRAAIVASEFPFREITGIELSAELADIARRNVEKMSQRFPGRRPITIRTGNALDLALPPGKSVLYMYHPFGREVMERFAAKLESALEAPEVCGCHSIRSVRNWLRTGRERHGSDLAKRPACAPYAARPDRTENRCS
jgi:cyclopropane fatty-acyl-phospholipid synthase-like methyltransferase